MNQVALNFAMLLLILGHGFILNKTIGRVVVLEQNARMVLNVGKIYGHPSMEITYSDDGTDAAYFARKEQAAAKMRGGQ